MKTTLFVVFGFRKRFSVVDVIDALTGSIGVRKYWYALKSRLKKDGSELLVKLIRF